jgi:energy-coupling factor transporter ATP-binding protein EcfA2
MHNLRLITVENLFGRYKYTLPAKSQLLDDVNILYGENGAGKTTVLNLVFHLLSKVQQAGHITKISEIPFLRLEVILQNGTKISATKDAQLLVGPVELKISHKGSHSVSWRFTPGMTRSIRAEDLPLDIDLERLPKDMREQVGNLVQQRRYYAELEKLDLTIFMLTSDRILLGDSVREATRSEPRGEGPRARARVADIVLEQRTAAVADALQSASNWIRTKFLDKAFGSNESSANVYLEVAKKIAKTTYRTKTGLSAAQEAKTITALQQSIRELQARAAEFQSFGVAVSGVSEDLLTVVHGVKGNRLQLINTILEPHLAGIKARYDALAPLHRVLSNFLSTLRKFLKDKSLSYSVRDGLQIFSEEKSKKSQKIEPAQLSSGEQQLILLFCHVLTTRDRQSIFIIDEPEISLNILWQRMLVDAMLDVAKGSDLQLILASHSMEILAKHRGRVVSMLEA